MKSFLNKFFFRSNNLDYISREIRKISQSTPVDKIFEAINSYSAESEIRYVGGCVRKIINKEKVDDIDLATNLEPTKVCEALKKNDIDYFESGIEHGTITAILGEYKFEITTLRKDILTDGRHAKVEFSNNWKKDASRRDFTINSIYSDRDGNLFDPFDGKKDLENGAVNFIGNADKRIQEDFLRILRYLRFFLNYSKQPHNSNILRSLKINISGIKFLSKERILGELKKMVQVDTLEKLSKDRSTLNLILIIFPELKNIKIFSRLDKTKKDLLKECDFIFLISLIVVDETDNVDYFLYRFNFSKKNQKRIKIIDNFYKERMSSKTFTKDNLNKIFYYQGKKAIIDILNYGIIKSKEDYSSLKELREYYENYEVPVMPITGSLLMKKYNIPEGKQLGSKLKIIEEAWVNNNFRILDNQIDDIINN